MLTFMRHLILVALFGSVIYGDDIVIPVDGGGKIVIRDPHFITINQFNIYEPKLTFALVNNTVTPWTTLNLQFAIGGFCKDQVYQGHMVGDPKVRQWSISVSVNPTTDRYEHNEESLVYKLQSCRAEIIKARIGGGPDSPSLSAREIAEQRAKREAKEAEQKRIADEQELIADEEKLRKAEEKEQIQAEERAKVEARAAEERRRIRATCAAIYRNTANKKVSDLTVKEEQQVRACQILGLYPP